jgi:glycosyltransferase involved in cell wall biosynthesis
VDDGSTDGTNALMTDFCKRRTGGGKRRTGDIIHHTSESQGLPKSRNRGVSLSQGDITIMLDADSEINDTFVESMLQTFHDHPDKNMATATIQYTTCTWLEEALVAILRRPLDDDLQVQGEMPLAWRQGEEPDWDEGLGFGGDRFLLEVPREQVAYSAGSVSTVHISHTMGELMRQQEYYGRGWFLYARRYGLRRAASMLWRIPLLCPFLLPPWMLYRVVTMRWRRPDLILKTAALDVIKSVSFTYGMAGYLLGGRLLRR